MNTIELSGLVVDLVNKKIESGKVRIQDGIIHSVEKLPDPLSGPYILPGFIDAHVHIESSMLIPSEFARLAVPHGTVGTVSDPHEIANVLGIEGIRYMVENGKKVPFHFHFGASSCVPATTFETAGANMGPSEIESLFVKDGLGYLSEMMNYPGVLHHDPEVMAKIALAKSFKKPVDGHAPGLRGKDAQNYISAGISTDHECFTLDEALEKVKCGMNIIIREGSAAKNFEALHPLLKMHPTKVMFCSDDKHPNDLVRGHINQLVKRAIIEKGYDPLTVLSAACYHPVLHYGLDIGLLRSGDPADFIVVDNLRDLNVLKTFIKGELVAENGTSFIPHISATSPNHFETDLKQEKDFEMRAPSQNPIRAILAIDGELITKEVIVAPKIENGHYMADPSRDLLKLTVVNRYQNTPPALAFIQGFGLKKGAIASSVAHDSHNILAVGADDASLTKAVNALIQAKGGVAVVSEDEVSLLPLPVAGLMSTEDGYLLASQYEALDEKAKKLGSTLKAPFMTLSFMALLVIPEIKLSDKGLFDAKNFRFISTTT